jgi:DNA polymerase-3 subunit delta'
MSAATPVVDEFDFHPRKTATLVGHTAAEAELKRAFESGRMPHAWLLAGPRGIGKATLAYRFARSVLAADGAGQDSLFGGGAPALHAVDAEHPVFRRVAAQAHPDLCVVETGVNAKTDRPREEILVEEARAAVTFFSHTSAEGGWRVVIIDAADELNTASANTLLKIIEEPPPRGLILLIAHRPGFVLPTIRSRARILRVKPLPPSDVTAVLRQQWPELQAEDLRALLAMSEGSPGRAIALAEADGVGFYRDLQTWVAKLPSMDVAGMHRIADRLAKRDVGRGFRVLAALPEWWLMRAIRTLAGQPPASEVVDGEIEVFGRVLGSRNLAHWVAVWEKVSHLLAQGIALNLDRKQLALTVLSALGRAARA